MLLQGQQGPDKPLVYGVKCLQNSRNVLEDAYAAEVISSSASPSAPDSADSDLLLFGVFDGHGGKEAALHAASSIPRNLRAALTRQALESVSSSEASSINSATQNADAVLSEAWPGSGASGSSVAELELGQAQELCSAEAAAAQQAGSPAGAGSGSWWASNVRSMPHLSDRYSKNVRRALQTAFIAADAELAGTEVGEVVGSTAVVAVVSKTEVFVAHCGDSRAVLCRKGTAIPLTNDHKPDRSDEAARVSALGGKVVVKGGSSRVMGLLAMTRAIGDHFLRPYVIPEPEVTSLQRTHEDELLILASDGLWDVFCSQEATTLALRSTMRARERGASISAACRVGASVLARGAIERGSRDNITVLVVDLRRSEGAGSVAAVLAAQCSELVLMGGCPHNRRKRSSSGGGPEEGGYDDDGNPAGGLALSSAAGGGLAGAGGLGFGAFGHGAGSAAAAGGSRSCGGALSSGPSARSGTSQQQQHHHQQQGMAVQQGAVSTGGGCMWSSSSGSSSGASRFGMQQHHAPPQYQQQRRPTHVEALASAWAAAAAAVSGRPQRNSSGSGGSTPRGRSSGASGSGGVGPSSATAAAAAAALGAGNAQQQQQQQPRSSAPGGLDVAVAAAAAGSRGASPFVSAGLANSVAAGGSAAAVQQQQQQMLLLDSMQSAPLYRGAGGSRSVGASPLSASPQASTQLPHQQQQQQQQPRASPCSVRSNSFSSYELSQRGRHSAPPGNAGAAAAAVGAEARPATEAAAAAAAAGGLQFPGGGKGKGGSADKPPLPPQHH